MVAGHGGKQARKQEQAIAALLTEPTIAAAAGTAGIGENTLLRWLADPSFKARYREARRQVVEHAVSGLQQAASKAVAALVEIAEDSTTPPGARVSAARTILDLSFRGMEVLDLAAEVEALRAEIAAPGESAA